jgi:hypothetical protein
LVFGYVLGTWLPVMVLSLYEFRRINIYIRDEHRQKWNELSHVPGFGPGGYNGFRFLPWLYSDDVLGDPRVTKLKREYRWFLGFVYSLLASYFVMIPALAN